MQLKVVPYFSFGIVGAALVALGSIAVAQDLVEVPLELPQPYFGGTPLDYFGPNLEKPNYKPRPAFMAPAGTTNVAKGKKVDSSDADPEFGTMELLVDGDKDYRKKSLLGLSSGHQWIQVDLGEVTEIYGILLWHFHEGERVYFDVAIHASDDAEFGEGAQLIFNNDHDNTAGLGVGKDQEYIESYKGKLFTLETPVKGRYVRFYSRGNTSDEMNHYVEAEIYGKVSK